MLRDQFLLDPGVVFLNHGSFGACPAPVFEAYQRFQRELERQPVEFLALERRFPELLETARTRLARACRGGLGQPRLRSERELRGERGRPLARARSRRRGAARRRRVRRDGAALALRGRTLRRHARAPAVLGARAGPTNPRRLLLAHRMDERARQRRRGDLPACARGRCALDRRRRTRPRTDRPRPRRARGGRLRRQLPQVAVRAEGRGLPLRAARGCSR